MGVSYSRVYNYLDTVGRGYKPRQRGWGGAATLQNVNLFLDFTIILSIALYNKFYTTLLELLNTSQLTEYGL